MGNRAWIARYCVLKHLGFNVAWMDKITNVFNQQLGRHTLSCLMVYATILFQAAKVIRPILSNGRAVISWKEVASLYVRKACRSYEEHTRRVGVRPSEIPWMKALRSVKVYGRIRQRADKEQRLKIMSQWRVSRKGWISLSCVFDRKWIIS